ncbi:NADP-dependent fatty aldehyde dehydrogenase domain protein, partial [Vibrio parahaemolyticus V-223/04]
TTPHLQSSLSHQ